MYHQNKDIEAHKKLLLSLRFDRVILKSRIAIIKQEIKTGKMEKWKRDNLQRLLHFKHARELCAINRRIRETEKELLKIYMRLYNQDTF